MKSAKKASDRWLAREAWETVVEQEGNQRAGPNFQVPITPTSPHPHSPADTRVQLMYTHAHRGKLGFYPRSWSVQLRTAASPSRWREVMEPRAADLPRSLPQTRTSRAVGLIMTYRGPPAQGSAACLSIKRPRWHVKRTAEVPCDPHQVCATRC